MRDQYKRSCIKHILNTLQYIIDFRKLSQNQEGTEKNYAIRKELFRFCKTMKEIQRIWLKRGAIIFYSNKLVARIVHSQKFL